MQTFKDSVTNEIYQYEDGVDVSKLASAPETLEPYIMPAPTQAELDAAALAAKWVTYAEYCSTLTVTAVSGLIFAADPEALKSVAFKRDAITDAASILWVEEWDTFNTDKVELQEVISEADRLMQLKIDALFGPAL